jgi:hypothetical protein
MSTIANAPTSKHARRQASKHTWFLLPAFQTHKDTKALKKTSNSDVNNRKYTNKQASMQAKKHTSKKIAQHNGEWSY